MDRRAAPDDARLIETVAAAMGGALPNALGVAVSGGGDSMALLFLLQNLAEASSTTLHVVTVDHGLRPEAAEEARMVARHAAALGLSHDTLTWRGWDGQGNLQNEAREARFSLIADWARQRGIGDVAMGHTADDQAETLLMRLARRAGVDGLTAMSPQSTRHGVTWHRPLLSLRREALREYLRRQGTDWAEDPGNEDLRYARIRARQALATLEPLGIDPQALADVAANMGSARAALDFYADRAAGEIMQAQAGAVTIDAEALFDLPDETRRRLVQRAIQWITGHIYPPRRAALSALIDDMAQGRGGTLDGCQTLSRRGQIWIFREFNALRGEAVPVDALWDGRWRVDGPQAPQGAQIRALGAAGLAQCSDWRALDLPRPVLLSTPGVWQGDTLLAAPLAGLAQKWHVQLQRDAAWLKTAPLSH